MSGVRWNFADLWEQCAAIRDGQRALVHGDRTVSWAELDTGADGVASAMLAAGVDHQDKVAQYLFNGPEYLESVFACFKAGLVPVNTNYRYTDEELVYLWDNADAVVVVFHGAFAPTIERIRHRLPKIRLWLWVDDGTGVCPTWATPYQEARSTPTDGPVSGPWGRSGDDRWFLYTGGTTGMPKGVMWTQDTLVRLTSRTHPVSFESSRPLPAWRSGLEATQDSPPVLLPAAPLMHGTGHITAIGNLLNGGAVVTLDTRSFDATTVLDVCQREGVHALVIVGDAFARPILAALDTEPGRWDLTSLTLMVSSGAMWSQSVKEALLEHLPQLTIYDALGSSEAIGMANSYSTRDNISDTASFHIGESAVVVGDDGELVAPGSGDIGRLGVTGLMPVGYYKDEVKTAATFPVIDGVRYSLPGDFATVEPDGSITLLGRGSVCINTGGEKVFPEEVEETLKTHPDVVDAIAVGVPDDRFGQAIAAVIEPTVDARPDEQALIDHVKASLAHYKAPRRVLVVDSLTRAPNGKVDYKRWTSYAHDRLSPETAR